MILDPRFEPNCFNEYEANRGYHANHARCVNENPRFRVRALNSLDFRGFIQIPVISKSLAERWAGRINRDGDFTARDMDKTEVFEFFQACITPNIEMLIQDYFHTTFAATSLAMYGSSPMDDPSCSFRWHCDSGPRKSLKMIVYLNDSHGGGTKMIDRKHTELFKRAGYVFGDLDKRLDDLTDLAQQFGIRYYDSTLCPPAGQGVIFEPSNVLHKGAIPRHKPRYVASMTFIPWVKGWRDFLQEQYKYICDNIGGDFSPIRG